MEKLDRIAKCYLENGAIHTLCVPFKDEAEAEEICLDAIERMTGLPREKIVRVTKVEIISVDQYRKDFISS